MNVAFHSVIQRCLASLIPSFQGVLGHQHLIFQACVYSYSYKDVILSELQAEILLMSQRASRDII